MEEVRMIRYICPYCNKENVTKVENPKQCPKCHRKFVSKKPLIIKEVSI